MNKLPAILALSTLSLSPLAFSVPTIQIDSVQRYVGYSLEYASPSSERQRISDLIRSDDLIGRTSGNFSFDEDGNESYSGILNADSSVDYDGGNSFYIRSEASTRPDSLAEQSTSAPNLVTSFSSDADVYIDFTVGSEDTVLRYGKYADLVDVQQENGEFNVEGSYSNFLLVMRYVTDSLFDLEEITSLNNVGDADLVEADEFNLLAGESYLLFSSTRDFNYDTLGDGVSAEFHFPDAVVSIANASVSVPAPANLPLILVALMGLFGFRKLKQ